MATSIKRSPYISPRQNRAFRLEMEGKTLFLLVALMALTGVVLFTLGVVTGMGMRDPATIRPSLAIAPKTEKGVTPAPEKNPLTFNKGVDSKEVVIEGLKIKTAATKTKTDSIINRAEKELKLEEVPNSPTPAFKPVTVIRKSDPPSPKAATTMPARPVLPRNLYTVQVFSSRVQKSAQNLVMKLKKSGFSAYINQYQGADNKTWYRVRVGKNDRAEAENLAERLKSEAQMKSPTVIKM